MILYIAMIASGLAIVVACFWGTFNARSPWKTIAGLSLPTGLVITLVGLLLLCIPDFFKG